MKTLKPCLLRRIAKWLVWPVLKEVICLFVSQMNELEDSYGNWQAKLHREKVEANERWDHDMVYVNGVRMSQMEASAMHDDSQDDTINYQPKYNVGLGNFASTSKRWYDE
jgi:hypothetical protein